MVIGKLWWSNIVVVVVAVLSLSVYYKVLSAKLRFSKGMQCLEGVIYEGMLGLPGCLQAP